ncbi:LOW QUALITY PROTEIN: olfactory receptor 51H1-like [Spheniscus humboldti]
MSSSNRTGSSPLTFILTGIPSLLMSSYWMALPLCCLYLLMLLGNCTLLWIIKTDHSLHAPMYYFLPMLAMADLGLSLSTLPTMLAIFWFESTSLRFEACIVQMYFIHSFSAIESGVLVATVFDRFVAICYSLHYASVLTSSLIMKAGGGAIFMRGICVVLPIAILIKKIPFCRSRVLSHSFCLHQDSLLRLVCGDVRVNSLYRLTVAILTKGLDSLTILLSYMMIIRAILNIVSQEARAKAFSTCISHLCAVLIFYIPLIGFSIIYRFGKHLPPLTHTLLADACLLVPPVLNLLVYSWKTKQILRWILILLCRRGTQQRV